MSEGKQSVPSSNNQQIKLDGFSFNLTANGEGSSSVRRNENGNFVLRFSLQNAKDFVLSSSSSPRQLKFKLPLKLKISTPVENNQANNSQTPNLSSQNKHTKLHSQNNGLKKQVQHYHAALPVASSAENHNNINLHHNQDLVKQSQIQILPYKTVEEFLDAVTAQSTSNKSYSLLMDSHLINQLISIRKQFYFNYDGLKEALFLLLNFLALSKNYSGAKPSLKSSLSIQSFAEQLGSSCRRIRDQAYNKNKNVLKIMDYIQPKGETDGSRYTHCYFTLKFDFSEEEVSKVAMATKYASRYNHKAFCFLTNYLFKSCLLLQNNNVGIMEIEDRLVNTISVLLRNHPPSQPLQGDDSLLKKHPTQSVPSLEYPIQQLDLKNIPKQKRVEKLQSFISQRAKEAQKNSKHFFRLIFDVCSKRGESLVTGIKIKNMRKRKAINRIKQKFFHSLSNKNHSQIQLQVNPNLSLQNYTKEELRQYKQSLNTIFSKMDEKINFGVDDLLRGRCIFSSIDSLNSCCSQLKQQIVKRGFKLLALLNRLHQQTCDIVLHIQIGKTIAQLQLVINHKLSQNQFNYKLRFLSQASFYNHITHLKAYNQKMSELFVEESLRYIQANFAAYNRIDYKQKTNYQSALINLKRFIKQSPFQFNREETDLNQMEIPMFAQEINYFENIKAVTAGPITVPSFELQKNNGDFLQEIGEIDKAEQYEEEYCHKVKEHHRDVLDKIKYGLVVSDNDQSVANNYAGALYVLGKIFKNKKQYAKSVQKFEESQAIVQHSGQKKEHVIESLGLIGQVHHKNGKLNESVKVYQRSLSFQQSFKGGNKTEDYVNTLLSLGLVYKQQGNYSQALKNLKKGLSIYESNKGKDHILLSNIYNQIASIQLLEGDLVGGLKNFKNTLDIIEKQKGKNSFDCSVVLANIGLIYQSDQNYYEAINNYEKAMTICSTHNLREQVYANSSYGLGKCYFSLKNHTKAMQYFIKSLSHFRKQKTQIYYTIIENIAQCNGPLKSIKKPAQISQKLQQNPIKQEQ